MGHTGLNGRTRLSKLCFFSCSCFFPSAPFDAEREKNEDLGPSLTSAGEYQAMSGQVSRGSAGEYQADERAGVARLSWRVSGR